MTTRMKNFVTQVQALPATQALAHFEAKLTAETDCWDVHATQDLDNRGFILVDVRSPEAFRGGHLPGAINIPHSALSARQLNRFDHEALFVVYCSGPHCNASTRAAIRIAELGRPVKEMIGGTTGWIDEGFTLERS